MRTLPLMLAALLAPPADALELAPTTLQLPVAQGRTALWVHNPEPTAWRGQVQILAWDQQADSEQLQPSAQILASPLRLDLPAGGRQRIWLLPADATPAVAEQAYRLILNPDDRRLPRYSLPLFRGGPATPTRPQLTAEVAPGPSQTLLRLDNRGSVHARISDLSYLAADGHRSLLWPGLTGYVLAARQRHWVLPARADHYRGGRFLARLQDGTEVVLAAPLPAIAASAPGRL